MRLSNPTWNLKPFRNLAFGAFRAKSSSSRSPYVKHGSLAGFAFHPKLHSKAKIPFIVRRVAGGSMMPTLNPGQIVLASKTFKNLSTESVVILRHGGLEKIKRLEKINGGKVFVLGDNPTASTDSRSFGWLDSDLVVGKVLWPRV